VTNSPLRLRGGWVAWLFALSLAFWLVPGGATASTPTTAPRNAQTPADWIGYPLPVLAGKALQGPNLRTSEYSGEVLLLAFWTTWCGRCEEQLGYLQTLHATYRSAGLVVLGVSLDDSAVAAREFAAEAGVGFPTLHDLTKRSSRQLALLDLPTLVLVDRGGAVRQVYGRLDRKARKALVEDIRQLLDE
jgi:peroxiredoxin